MSLCFNFPMSDVEKLAHSHADQIGRGARVEQRVCCGYSFEPAVYDVTVAKYPPFFWPRKTMVRVWEGGRVQHFS